MSNRTIDAIIGSPPEREELIVQLFHRDGPLIGEVYREQGGYWIQFLNAGEGSELRLNADELLIVLQKSLSELRLCFPDNNCRH